MISRRNKYIPPTILRLYIQIKFTCTMYFKLGIFYLECSWICDAFLENSVFFHPVDTYSISFENHDKHELRYIGYRCFYIHFLQYFFLPTLYLMMAFMIIYMISFYSNYKLQEISIKQILNAK